MKKYSYLIVIFLLFFNTITKADDIKDLEIEGITIGDSLLSYISKEEINILTKTDYKSKLYSRLSLRAANSIKLKKYDDVQVHFKTKDNNFIIVSISGGIYNTNEFDKCLKEKEKVIKNIASLVPNTITNDGGTKPWLDADPSGKTITSPYYFNFGTKKYNDWIEIACYDWSQKLTDEKGWTDHLKVALHTKEFDQWLTEEAWK